MFCVITYCSPHTFKRPILPQISQIYADKTQNNKTALTSPVCLSLRYNAACCIPLRDLRNLRENIHPNLLNLYCSNETPISPADLADLRRQTTKQQNSLNLKLTVFLCDIMQLAAFLCVICVICGRIFTQEDSINQRENKQHIICETPINNKEGCALAHPSLVILQSIPCS